MVIFCARVANRDERKWRKRREGKEVLKYDEQMQELQLQTEKQPQFPQNV